MNIKKTTVFPSSGRARIRVLIYLRIDGKALIDLRGLTTLKIRKAFKFMSKLNSSIKLYVGTKISSDTISDYMEDIKYFSRCLIMSFYLPRNSNYKVDDIPSLSQI